MDTDLLAFVTGLDVQSAKEVAKEAASGEKGHRGKTRRNQVSIKDTPLATQQTQEPTSLAGLADFALALGDDTGFASLKKQLGVIATGDDVLRLGQDFGTGNRKRSRRLEEVIPQVQEPLARVYQDKVNREAAYHQTTKELAKWQPIIQHNRQQRTLSFPINAQTPGPLTTATLGKVSQPKTDFERDYQAALAASGMATEGDIRRLEEMEANQLTVADMEARFAELSKKRSLLFFRERKQKHQARIKSKKYRKIRAKDKTRLKATEEATLTPEERRIKAELARAKERLTLKTRKANKWAQEMIHRRHVDRDMRQEIVDQIRDKERLRQEIFGRAADLSADEEDADGLLLSDDEATGRPDEDFFEPSSEDAEGLSDDGSAGEMGTSSEDEEPVKDPNAIIPRKTFGSIEAKSGVDDDVHEFQQAQSRKGKKSRLSEKTTKGASANLIASRQELFEAADDEALTQQQQIIRQAFADDDLFAEFQAEKEAIAQADAPQTVDLTLPGWGSWSGAGVAPPKNPVKVVLKPKPGEGVQAQKRKDWGMKNVIINERQNKKAAQLLSVQKVPFPYKSQEEYERATLAMPLGPEFNAASVYRKRIQPRVQVKVGSIIDPIKFHKQPKH